MHTDKAGTCAGRTNMRMNYHHVRCYCIHSCPKWNCDESQGGFSFCTLLCVLLKHTDRASGSVRGDDQRIGLRRCCSTCPLSNLSLSLSLSLSHFTCICFWMPAWLNIYSSTCTTAWVIRWYLVQGLWEGMLNCFSIPNSFCRLTLFVFQQPAFRFSRFQRTSNKEFTLCGLRWKEVQRTHIQVLQNVTKHAHMCTCTKAQTNMHTHMHVCMCTHTHTHTHKQTNKYTHTHHCKLSLRTDSTCMYAAKGLPTHVCRCVHACVHAYVCVPACVCVCVYVNVFMCVRVWVFVHKGVCVSYEVILYFRNGHKSRRVGFGCPL